jgi:hypothetical protein
MGYGSAAGPGGNTHRRKARAAFAHEIHELQSTEGFTGEGEGSFAHEMHETNES